MHGTIVKNTYYFILDMLPDFAAVNLMYFRRFREFPNLRNPKSFNEKIAWRKLYQRNPLFPKFADKITVKAEIAKLIGEQHIIETLWTGFHPADIPFGSLKPPYVIKVNHSSGGNVFIRTAQDIDRRKIVESILKQLRYSHGHRFREWAYVPIPRRVMVERMIEMPGGDVPEDYRFFVYHGRVHFLQVDFVRFEGYTGNSYDREWNLLPVRVKYPPTAKPVPKPAKLDQMIEIAEK